jgi:aminopeptidase N
MRDAQASSVYLSDYRVPDYLIDTTSLHFHLGESETRVRSTLVLRRNPAAAPGPAPLLLHGVDLELLSLQLDGRELCSNEYRRDEELLTIAQVPEKFTLQCETRIHPETNTSLEGLYKSRVMFCTQCEAEGFRKITYFIDRPDVMSVYTVTIDAERSRYPVLLSNGNLVEANADIGDGYHRAVWHDPFPKPSYLFALVAGDLAHIEDRFTTMTGREVTLRIYAEAKDVGKCAYAMDALKRSMRWDEEVYGREYDLDIFNIVAVDDFNMGAMENKSLNIFNTSCLLAMPETTTDAGFQRVEAVVAHEYFHNWSGNRVTLRDWFQLSLKEGFTVFRDSQFSADMGSPTVKRVEDVSLLRTLQFAEDAGPMAHPVRPEAYMEISNFYTLTVYEKGSEVVRMLSQLLGPKLFRRGCDLYFERYDGQAVTCDDFVRTMEEVSGRDLTQFKRWYSQAGTPKLDIFGNYDENARTFALTVQQSCPPSPGQPTKLPFHIPLAVALYGDAGALRLQLQGMAPNVESSDNTELVLDVTEPEQVFVFTDVPEKPVPSLLRGFSAPVRLHYPYTRDELLLLMRSDSDGFCRWDAGQQLAVAALRDMMQAWRCGEAMLLDRRVIDAFATLLSDETLDPAMVALMLTLPTEAYLAEISDEVDVWAIHQARDVARQQIAQALEGELWRVWNALASDEPYAATAAQIARRSLRNACLSYLMVGESSAAVQACVEQFERGHNMTDVMAALTALVNSSREREAQVALAQFYQRWQQEPLVVNQWFQVQAMSARGDVLSRVRALMQHKAFDIRNPNKVRALIGAFAASNPVGFHRQDGAGYAFLAEQVIALDALNPQIAARQLAPLTKWQKYPADAREKMIAALRGIEAHGALSPDVFEVVSKSLATAG